MPNTTKESNDINPMETTREEMNTDEMIEAVGNTKLDETLKISTVNVDFQSMHMTIEMPLRDDRISRCIYQWLEDRRKKLDEERDRNTFESLKKKYGR